GWLLQVGKSDYDRVEEVERRIVIDEERHRVAHGRPTRKKTEGVHREGRRGIGRTVADQTHDARPAFDQRAGGGAILVHVLEEGAQRRRLLVNLREKVLAGLRRVQRPSNPAARGGSSPALFGPLRSSASAVAPCAARLRW